MLLKNSLQMDSAGPSGLPPKLGLKKRKPRASNVVDVANARFRKSAPSCPTESADYAADDRYEETETGVPLPYFSSRQLPQDGQVDSQNPDSNIDASYANQASGSNDADTAKRKGLRHFAVRVCKKVEEKSVTTYNEVADELVLEEKQMKQQELDAGGRNAAALRKKFATSGSLVDEKNIRRRVYDSLNVLMAMGIIQKDKKLISWKGIAKARGGAEEREATAIREAIEDRRRAIELKRERFELLEDYTSCVAALIRRNAQQSHTTPGDQRPHFASVSGQEAVSRGSHRGSQFDRHGTAGDASVAVGSEIGQSALLVGTSGGNDTGAHNGATLNETRNTSQVAVANGVDADSHASHADRISVPFLVVSVSDDSKIELEMDQAREDVVFTFSSPFAALDDHAILRRMRLN